MAHGRKAFAHARKLAGFPRRGERGQEQSHVGRIGVAPCPPEALRGNAFHLPMV